MRSPDFYPDAPASVDIVESHISWVFLVGDRAFKLRKPVVFPFLDYGTPDRRRHMCEEEVRLGRRLAPDLYLGVRPLVRVDGGWALGAADVLVNREGGIWLPRRPAQRSDAIAG